MNKIGYIKVNTFAMTTFDEFMKGLRELKEHGMTKSDSRSPGKFRRNHGSCNSDWLISS